MVPGSRSADRLSRRQTLEQHNCNKLGTDPPGLNLLSTLLTGFILNNLTNGIGAEALVIVQDHSYLSLGHDKIHARKF